MHVIKPSGLDQRKFEGLSFDGDGYAITFMNLLNLFFVKKDNVIT